MGRRRGKGLRVFGAVLVALLAAGGIFLFVKVDAIAKQNLSSADFVRTHSETPWELGISAENVTLVSTLREPDVRLGGWWMESNATKAPGAIAKPTVVLVHGLGSNMSRPLRQWAPFLLEAGHDVLAFDLANHGSSGNTTDGYVSYGLGEALDVRAAIAFARQRNPGLPVVAYGGSMGGAAALLAWGEADAVIADSAYASFQHQARLNGKAAGYPEFLTDWVVSRMDARSPFDPSRSSPEKAVAEASVPILLMHCSNDERVQASNLERMVAVGNPQVRSWVKPCEAGQADHHLEGWHLASYTQTVLDFLGSVAGEWAATQPYGGR